jgi:predicted SAM-dependent methyltransferase
MIPVSPNSKPGPACSAPGVMPLDREQWKQQLELSNFVNTYFQYRDLNSLKNIRRILIVGPGQGLDTQILKWRQFDVTTFDIDDTFRPDHLGSVHNLSLFESQQFDAVIVSHVLEHLPVSYLDQALAELSRVARYTLIYLPVAGRHGFLRFRLGLRGVSWSGAWDFFNPFHRPDGLQPRYREGQHFWELGMKGFTVRDLHARFQPNFEIVTQYRNYDWIHSYNFVLRSTFTK